MAGWDAQWDTAAIRRVAERMVRATGGTTRRFAGEVWRNIGDPGVPGAPIDTGRLAGSFNLRQVGALHYLVSTNVDYALAVLEGTRPHVIAAKNASVLRFEVGGTVLYRARVNHPGTKPNDYVGRSIQAAARRLPQFTQEALAEQGL